MNVPVEYGTGKGQTVTVARFPAEHLVEGRHTGLTANAAESRCIADPRKFEAALIAAPVHAGRDQRGIVDFVRRNAAAIRSRDNAFVPISLSASGADPQDRAATRRDDELTDWHALGQLIDAFLAQQPGMPAQSRP